jgi:hypothetical protein
VYSIRRCTRSIRGYNTHAHPPSPGVTYEGGASIRPSLNKYNRANKIDDASSVTLAAVHVKGQREKCCRSRLFLEF